MKLSHAALRLSSHEPRNPSFYTKTEFKTWIEADADVCSLSLARAVPSKTQHSATIFELFEFNKPVSARSNSLTLLYYADECKQDNGNGKKFLSRNLRTWKNEVKQ